MPRNLAADLDPALGCKLLQSPRQRDALQHRGASSDRIGAGGPDLAGHKKPRFKSLPVLGPGGPGSLALAERDQRDGDIERRGIFVLQPRFQQVGQFSRL